MTQTATKTNATTHKGIETTGIEIVKESQRTARPQDLFLPWFASNVSVFGMSYGACLLYTSPSPRDQRGSRMPSSA